MIQCDGRGSGEILAVDQCQNTQCGKLSVGVVALTDKYYLGTAVGGVCKTEQLDWIGRHVCDEVVDEMIMVSLTNSHGHDTSLEALE